MIKFILKRLMSYAVLLFKGGEGYARYLGVTVGDNCRILTSNFGSEPFLITIGNNVTVSSGTRFITHDGSFWLMKDDRGRRYQYAPIVIGNNVMIGGNSIILPGVRIDDRVIIGAGSVVTKSIPSGVIVAGVPARIIGNYSDFESRTLKNAVSEQEIDRTLDYKDRVNKIVAKEFKPYLADK
jgi:acetyltransferase-like isoleucine patch superfamily enzyme